MKLAKHLPLKYKIGKYSVLLTVPDTVVPVLERNEAHPQSESFKNKVDFKGKRL